MSPKRAKPSRNPEAQRQAQYLRLVAELDAASRVPAIVPGATWCAGTMRGRLAPSADTRPAPTRPGADDHKALGSRYMDTLTFADGRVADLRKGAPAGGAACRA